MSYSSKKKRWEEEEDGDRIPRSNRSAPHNGYRVREMEVSEIPEHIIENMRRIKPKQSNCDVDGLTLERIQEAASSSDGGIWILKCPKDVKLSSLLSGKKLSLDGGSCVLNSNEDDDDTAQLTQFVPSSDSLGINIKDRQYEASTVVNEENKAGTMLIIPDANQFNLVTVPVQGHIVIRECVENLQLPEIKIPKTKPRKLPKGIKERHPVYGSDFTQILEEMESSSKKKRKKSKSYEPDTTNVREHSNGFTFAQNEWEKIIPKVEIESDNDAEHAHIKRNGYSNSFEESSSSGKKKSKKRKRHELEESWEDLNNTILLKDCEPVRKKSKKSKHKYHD